VQGPRFLPSDASLSAKTIEKELAMSIADTKPSKEAAPRPANGITSEGKIAIAGSLNAVIADLFALHMKTKNFHWHMTGPHFREYHRLLDEQSEQVLATIDPVVATASLVENWIDEAEGRIWFLAETIEVVT
jgi:DNA-binding ferritin-like protein